MVKGRMPSDILGLDLEPEDTTLHLFDPKASKRLLTASERAALAEDEKKSLRRELENLRRQQNS